jgi:hypothetical protein
MLDENEKIRRGFVAERRSLLIVSFILFFYQQAGLQIERISVFGNEAKISDPWWIAFGLWVLWSYFLLRFYQYFRSIPDKGFQTVYEAEMKKTIARSAFRRYKNSFLPEDEDTHLVPHFKVSKTEFPMTFPEMWMVDLTISVAYTWGSGGKALGGTHKEDVRGTRLLWAKTKSIFHVSLSSHVVTEYVLPFVVALLPLANWLLKDRIWKYPTLAVLYGP